MTIELRAAFFYEEQTISVVHSNNATHRADMIAYEATRQTAVAAAAGSASGIKAAEIAFFQSARSSAIANNCSPSQFIAALREIVLGCGRVSSRSCARTTVMRTTGS